MAESSPVPKKALIKIFGYLPPRDRQNQRLVCTSWNKLIKEEFPLEIKITNTNFLHFFQCPNAQKVTVSSLVAEYNGPIFFKESLTDLTISGKALGSNVIRILKSCKNIETLELRHPKDVISIETNEVFVIPKLKTLDIKIRMDQETFTSGEIILLGILSSARLPCLEKVRVTSTFDFWGEEDGGEGLRMGLSSSSGFSFNQFWDTMTLFADDEDSMSDRTLVSNPGNPAIHINSDSTTEQRQLHQGQGGQGMRVAFRLPSLPTTNRSEVEGGGGGVEGSIPAQDIFDLEEYASVINVAPEQSSISSATTTIINVPPPTPMNAHHGGHPPHQPAMADVSVGMTVVTEASSRNQVLSRMGLPEYAFLSRFMANAQMRMWTRSSPTDLESYLNESTSRSRRNEGIASIFGVQNTGGGNNPSTGGPRLEMKNTAFLDIMRNSSDTMKSLIVKARSDFLCFGNISANQETILRKIQLENVEYSFGRSKHLCSEYLLLELQKRLKSLVVNVLDDLWDSVMVAARLSGSTLEDLDVKVLSLSETPIDLQPLSQCKKLTSLKLFHFFEKRNVNMLPPSLNKLVMNGPLTKEEMSGIATRLQNLVQFDLILNHNANEKIDLPLFKKFLALPKLTKLIFIQTHIDVEGVSRYCEETKGITVVVQGPREIREPFTLTTSIQYIAVMIDRQQFKGSQQGVQG